MVARIRLEKTGVFNDGGNGFAELGEEITYEFTIENRSTAGEEFQSITLTDTQLGIVDLEITFADPLAPRAAMTISLNPITNQPFIYALTAEDLDAGSVQNSATLIGTLTDDTQLAAVDGSESTGYNVRASLEVAKTATAIRDTSGPGGTPDGIIGNAGDTVDFSIEVENTSPRTALNVVLTDDLPDGTAINVPLTGLTDGDGDTVADDLAIGDTAIGTVEYVIRQVDEDNRAFVNSAQATANTRSGTDDRIVGSNNLTVSLNLTPSIALEKQVVLESGTGYEIRDTDQDGFDSVDDEIVYRYQVINDGKVPLTQLKLVDDNGTPLDPADDQTLELKDAAGNVLTTLAPGAEAFADYTGQLTQAAIDARDLSNTAEVTGRAPSGQTVTASDDAFVIPQVANIALTKTASQIADANADGRDSAGDTVTYAYVVENTGDLRLTDVNLVDDNGTPADATDDVVVSLADATGNPLTELLPRQQAFATYIGTLTQNAIDAGTLQNIAVVQGTAPKGGIVDAVDDAVVSPVGIPEIQLEKVVVPERSTNYAIRDTNGDGFDSVGDEISYRYSVTNTGSVTLSNVTLVDDQGTPLNTVDDQRLTLTDALENPLTTLVPGTEAFATYTGTLTQAAIDARSLTNIAQVTATAPDGTQLTAQDDAAVTPRIAGITLTKTAGQIVDADADGRDSVGDEITYRYVAENTGEVLLNNLALVDDNGTPSDTADDVSVGLVDAAGVPVDQLLPGQQAFGTYVGQLTQSALDAGTLKNIAEIVGIAPKGGQVTATDAAVVVPTPNPSITLEKSVVPEGRTNYEIRDTNGDGFDSVGDAIVYRYTVANTGTVTLSDISLVDDNGTPLNIADDQTLVLEDADGRPVTTLAAGEVAFADYTGSLTQAAIAAKELTNIAAVTAIAPSGATLAAQDDASVNPQVAGISLTKTASQIVDTDGNGFDSVGDAITYRYVVDNTGDVLLTNLILVDDNGTPADATDDEIVSLADPTGSLITELVPGQQAVGTYTGVLTQAAIDAGTLENIAIIQGTAPKGGIVEATDRAVVSPTMNPRITLEKEANPIADLRIGDTVTYSYTTRNVGNSDLFNVVVSDDNGTPSDLTDDFTVVLTTGLSDLDLDGQVDDLPVNGTARGTVTRTLTAQDLAADTLTNIAVVTAVDRQGTTVDDQSDATITFAKDPKISLEKEARVDIGHDHCLNAGDTIIYTFTVANTGEVVIDQLTIVDALLPQLNAALGERFTQWLAQDANNQFDPGESFSIDFDYTITEADIHNHGVTNTATIYGNPLGGTAGNEDDAVAAAGVDVRFDGDNWTAAAITVEIPLPSLPETQIDVPSQTGAPSQTDGVIPPVPSDVAVEAMPDVAGLTTEVPRQGSTFFGTAADEMMLPTVKNDSYTMFGNGGRDVMWTHDGDDQLYGGDVFDFFFAGAGDNYVYANGGINVAIAGHGNNTFYGGSVLDIFITGAGNDTIYAQDGLNVVFADGGENDVYIGSGIDYVGVSASSQTTFYNFEAQQDKLVLVDLDAASLDVVANNQDTMIMLSGQTIATLNGKQYQASDLEFVGIDDVGLVSSLSTYIPEAFRTTAVRDQLVGAGVPSQLIEPFFAA